MKKITNWFVGMNAKYMKNKFGKKFWIILVVIILFIGYLVYSAQKNLPKYETTEVTQGNLLETLSTTGRVKADEYATLGFQTGGRVKWVGVKKGDIVKKGQAIASLDTLILNAAYQQALNNYRNYQTAAASALDSVKDHSGDETFAQKATRTAAEVARDNSYDAMLAAEQNLKYATIYSPFAGIVAEANPTFSGANVSVGGANYIIVNPKTTYFESEIAETDLPKVKVGQKVKLKLDAYPNSEIDGQIENIGVVAFTSSTGGNAYSLRINLPENLDQKFKVGMEGDVKIILETITDVLKIPTTAIVNEEDVNYVWVFESAVPAARQGKVKKYQIEIGGNSDEDTQIKSGISENAKIIVEPSNKFKDGQKIRI